MEHVQSIIVYRNPAEAMFWESGLSFPLMAAMVVGFVVACLVAYAIEMLPHRIRNHRALKKSAGILIVALAFIAGGITFNILAI